MYPGPLTTVDFDGSEPVRLAKWKVNQGHRLSKGTIIFTYCHADKESKFVFNQTDVSGTITDLLVNEGDTVEPGQSILRYLSSCSHPIVMKDLCAECGLDLRELGESSSPSSFASVSMIHSVPELRVTQEQAEKLGKADVDRLLKLRKLVLLVDLDQTLIHSTNEDVKGIEGVHTYNLYGPGTLVYHTKFRPHTLEFLKEISQYFELHICTFGARMYAHKMAELLDPTQEYFYHRILSRDECFDPTSKTGNLKALFPCGDSLVCIIDDREDVWQDAPNLVSVKPYYFFKNTGDINSPFKRKEPSIFQNPFLETPTEESSPSVQIEDDDDYLLYLESILKRIHSEYFSRYDELVKYTTCEEEYVSLPDLKKIVPEVKKRTLKGVNIVFSGVIPTDMPIKDSKIYKLATTLGARVSKDINPDGSPLERTTHLIAAKPRTAKVIKALKCGQIYLVNPLWLFCCGERWERVDESLFTLNKDDDFSAVQERKVKSQPPKEPPGPSTTSTEKAPEEESDTCPVYDSITGKKISLKLGGGSKRIALMTPNNS